MPTPGTTKKAAARPVPANAAGYTPVPFDLDRMLSLDEAAVLTRLSRDSLKRHYSHLIRQLSLRRVGIRLRDALSIGGGNTATTASNATL
jgi:hypothetical protein